MHAVEQGEINMFNGNFCVQFAGKPVGYLPGYPVLPKWGPDKNIGRSNKDKQRQEEPFQYFFKSPQVQLFKMQK